MYIENDAVDEEKSIAPIAWVALLQHLPFRLLFAVSLFLEFSRGPILLDMNDGNRKDGLYRELPDWKTISFWWWRFMIMPASKLL